MEQIAALEECMLERIELTPDMQRPKTIPGWGTSSPSSSLPTGIFPPGGKKRFHWFINASAVEKDIPLPWVQSPVI